MRVVISAALFLSALMLPSSVTFAEDVPGDLVHFDLEGKRFVLSDYVPVPDAALSPAADLEGPVVLVFGAHWCEPCDAVMSSLAAARAELDRVGAHVVYVHVDDKDRSDGTTTSEIRERVAALATKPNYADVRILTGGDLLEVETWMDGKSALPGIVFVAGDGSISARASGVAIDETLTSVLTSWSDP